MGRDKIELGMAPPAVRGRARVQLFDAATGNETLNVQHENFVSERYLRSIAWIANWAALAYSNPAAPTDYGSLFLGGAQVPFGDIALTDYGGAPDQAERFIRGIPLGHGAKGYAGSGDFRGTYNVGESVHRFGYHKFVYDFATNQANGIFQSIYTLFRGLVTPVTAQVPMGYRTQLAPGGHRVEGVFARADDGSLYAVAVDGIYQVTDWTPMTYGQPPVWERKAAFAVRPVPSLVIRGGRAYWLTPQLTSPNRVEIISAPLSNLTNTTTEKVLDQAWWTAHQGSTAGPPPYLSLAFHDVRNTWLITNTSGNSFGVIELAADTFADGNKFGTGSQVFQQLTTFPGETGFIASTGSTSPTATSYQFEDDGSLTPTATYPINVRPFGTDMALFSEGSSPSTVATTWRFMPAQFFFSRALLDAPVEKTAQNTMKITYEFTFDEPVLP